jgi:hypothetical protein
MGDELESDERLEASEPLDTSDDLDLVTVFSSNNHDAEMEAMAIRGVLDAAGVPSLVVGTSVIPVFSFEVRVPSIWVEEAERLIAESRAAGPQGAEEAEKASEAP